ncbi:MAG TPA: hypothetical protein VMB18_00925 [Terriglobales bacterium]|nr:hypothetical protein [Terriglobales bacterium]
MPRMIDLVRKSAVPSNLMQFAAKGALLVPAPEMVEILVYLATENPVFGEQARLTLAGWDPTSAAAVASHSATPKEVLDYFVDPENLRPDLLPVLIENPSVEESQIVRLAVTATREQVEVLLNSPRANERREILSALLTNGNLRPNEAKIIEEKVCSFSGTVADVAEQLPDEIREASDTPPTPAGDSSDQDEDDILDSYLTEHAREISAENAKNFEPTAELEEDSAAEDELEHADAVATATNASGHGAAAAPARKAVAKKWTLSAEEQRGSALQKISKLDVKGRINLAVKGTKEERSILIRDGTKIVCLAVLESPKVTDGEVEKFASQKNVLEAVLRAIPMKRRYMKLYPVVRNLTFNPRTPIDVSLGLMKNLLVQDLRHLSGNKEVSETVRKLALKMFKQKLSANKK